jgi:hypothetical protein
MVSLKMAFHSVTGRRLVEVYDNAGQLVAGIYPDAETNGINIISKYLNGVVIDEKEPPAVTVKFKR